MGLPFASRLLATGLAFALVGSAAAGDPPPTANRASVRGVVVDREGKPLSWVQVWCSAGGPAQETGADGRFAFVDLPLEQVEVSASLIGVPSSGPKPDVLSKATPGDKDLVLVVDRGAELVVSVEGTRFPGAETTTPLEGLTSESGPGRIKLSGTGFFTSQSMSFGPTRLYVETKQGWSAWYPAVADGSLAFRRIPISSPWQLFVAWSESTQGTCLVAGEALKPGAMTVTLERGKPISGVASLPPPPSMWAGPPRDRVEARRGPVVVPGEVDWWTGQFALPPLPEGTWTVTLRSSRRVATVDAAAGSTLTLEPKEPEKPPPTKPPRAPKSPQGPKPGAPAK